MIYLASPYSDPDPLICEARFVAVCRAAAELMRKGANIFSPIAHTHPIAQFGLPKGWEFWEQYDRLYLEACSELWVLMLDGWRESKGITGEIRIINELGKPVRCVDPHTLNTTPYEKEKASET